MRPCSCQLPTVLQGSFTRLGRDQTTDRAQHHRELGTSVRAFSTVEESPAQRPMKMAFALRYHCEFGQNISILGSTDSLGRWDTAQCIDMHWSENDLWTVEIESFASRGQLEPEIEYKYVVRNQLGGIDVWKPGENYILKLPADSEAERIRICDAWDQSCRKVEVDLRSATEGKTEYPTFEQAALSLTEAAEEALAELRTIVDTSTTILDKVDPTSAEALAADCAVASAAQKASKLTKALNDYRRTGRIADSCE